MVDAYGGMRGLNEGGCSRDALLTRCNFDLVSRAV